MTAVALQCKINNHHPEWSNVSLMPREEGRQERVESVLKLVMAGLQHHLHPLDDA